MKAAQINGYGGKEVMQTVGDAPKPQAEAGQVLVAVRAAGVNPFDWKVREGYMKDMVPLTMPATLGGDVSGVVSEVGADVTGFAVGDEVYGLANALSGAGSFAEFTAVAAGQLAPKPTSVDFNVAASLPLAGSSAYQALVDHMHLQSGQKVLIHGGAGGIGTFAIQLAKHLGAYVATTAATDDLDYVRSLGADEVIDYQNQPFEAVIKDFDAAYDTVGGETTVKSYGVLKPGGVLVSMVAPVDEALAKEHDTTFVHQSTQATTERLTELAKLVDAGVIKPVVDKIFSLDEASEALAYLEAGTHRGKVVVNVA